MTSPTPKKKLPAQYTNDNIIESLRNLGGGIGTTTKDATASVSADVLTSLFGGSIPKSGELRQNETLNFDREHVEQAPGPQRRVELQPRPVYQEDKAKLKQQIAAIRDELKALMASLKSLHQEVATAVEQAPVDPGVYHLNFFEQLRTMLKVLRQQIEDSRAWLTLWTSRKKKMGYWAMFKKHGTSFGLSSERVIATSAG